MEVRFQCPCNTCYNNHPTSVISDSTLLLSLLQNISFCLLSKVCFMIGACMHAKLLQWCLILCNPIRRWPQAPPSVKFSDKNTGGCHALSEDLPDQESNLHLLRLLHWQEVSFTIGAACKEACFMIWMP